MIPSYAAPHIFHLPRRDLGGSNLRWVVAIAYLALALLACQHVILDNKTMGPEVLFQEDRLYGYPGQPARRMYDDPTPVCIDYPRDLTIGRSIHSGKFFAWNPWSATGVPLAAEQGGVFFPLRIPFYLFPNPRTYDAFRISRLLLAAVGAYALARSRGCSRGASFVAGGLFELSGPMVWMVPFAATSAAYVLPLLLLCVRRLFSRSASLSSIAALGVTLGLVLLGGHPGIGAVCLLAAAGAFVGESLGFVRSRRLLLRTLGGAALAGVLGLLLSAPSVLPFAELLAGGHTYKHTGIAASIWNGDLAATREMFGLGMFTPRLVNVLRDSYPKYPYSLNGVCGLAALSLALVALWKRRVRFGLVLVACLGVVLSFGLFGYSSIAGSVPLLQYILPRYCVVLVILPVSQWAAEGLDSFPWWRGGGARSWSTPRSLAQLGTLLLPLGVLAAWMCIAYLCRAAMTESLRTQIQQAISASSDQRFRYLYFAALVGLSIVAGRISLRAGRFSLGLIAVVELALYAMPHFNEPISNSIRHGRPIAATKLAQLAQDSHSRIGSTESTLGLTQFNLVDAIPDIRITAALVPQRYYDFMRLLGADFYTIFVPPTPASPLLDMAAVKFFALSTAAAGDLPMLMPIDGGGIYLNPYAAPRARLFSQVSTVDNEPQAVEWLSRAVASSRHLPDSPLLEHAVVEVDGRGADELRKADLSEGGGDANAPGRVTFERDEPDHVALRVSAPGYRFLVLADTFYPGWHARIDGQERQIFPSDLLFRGVIVPPGVHQVIFDYRPLSLWLGCLLALCTWLAVAVQASLARLKRKNAGDPIPVPAR